LGYPHTLNGLIECYTIAIPFFGYSIFGDLAWSFVLFGLYDLVEQKLIIK
jgi:hypothetical protein